MVKIITNNENHENSINFTFVIISTEIMKLSKNCIRITIDKYSQCVYSTFFTLRIPILKKYSNFGP